MSDELAQMDGDGLAIASMEQDMLGDMIKANLGGDELRVGDLDRIDMPSGGRTSWEVPTIEGTESQEYIEGIIVDWKETRAYWDQDYEDDPGAEPDCRSPDSEVGFGDPGGKCDDCPMSEWESADSGSGQACRKNRLLFVVSEDQILPNIIELPPSSITPCRQYFMRLLNNRMDHSGVVTKIGLEKVENDAGVEYSQATFTVSRTLEEDERGAVDVYREQIAPDLEVDAEDVDDMEAEDAA